MTMTAESLSEQEIVNYLRNNKQFFERHSDLLADISLPHQRGAAVSLVEKQVAVLRERNIDLRRRLNSLLDNAERNDEIFTNTRKLVVRLLAATSSSELAHELQRSLSMDFALDFASLCLLDTVCDTNEDSHNDETLPTIVRTISQNKEHQALEGLLNAKQVVCGILRDEELSLLFGDDCKQVLSAAVVPIVAGDRLGILALGSKDKNEFKSGMGTLFVDYIGEVLASQLQRVLGN